MVLRIQVINSGSGIHFPITEHLIVTEITWRSIKNPLSHSIVRVLSNVVEKSFSRIVAFWPMNGFEQLTAETTKILN